MEQAWTKSNKEVLKYFNVEEDSGYSDDQVKRAQEKYGPNGKSNTLSVYLLTLPYRAPWDEKIFES